MTAPNVLLVCNCTPDLRLSELPSQVRRDPAHPSRHEWTCSCGAGGRVALKAEADQARAAHHETVHAPVRACEVHS